MKYIFRFTIVLHFTENPQKLTSADLVSALASNKFPYADRWEELVDYTKPCIEGLIATLNKDNLVDSQAEVIRSHMEKLKIEFDLDGLVQIWESEKQKVLGNFQVDYKEKYNLNIDTGLNINPRTTDSKSKKNKITVRTSLIFSEAKHKKYR